MLEVNGEVDIVVDTGIEATSNNTDVAIIEDTNDISVTVNRQEYVITGDEIYIPKRYEDAPTWMQNLINQVVDVSITAQIQDLNQISQSLESLIDAMEVAKNTYEMSVISSNEINQRINTAITTLNSSMNDADATILEVAQTRVTPEEASTITVDVITAELAKTEAGTLGATVSNLQTAIANEEEARSTSIEILTSSIEGAFDANATAMNYINTYVGLDEVGASTGTGLSGYLEGSTGIIGEADSKVVNNIYVDALGNAKSKFEYGSTVSVNGVTHTAGFGLSNSTGTDIGSEFWINADKFKFTNNNKTGSKAPFTIDATGEIPEITFNGKVSFTNVTGTSNLVSTSNIQNAIANNVTTIDGGKIVTNQVFVHNLNATGGVVADSVRANTVIGNDIYGSEINGTIINGSIINGARINGAVIKASYLDLDGDLEVLTDYHITIAMYNANPSLYTDAVYISADNEYRIPTTSSVTYNNVYGTSFSNFYTNIWSYTTANAGNNNKARKSRPYISFPNGTFEIGNQSAVNTSASCSAYIYFGNIMIIGIVIDTGGEPTGKCSIYNHTGLIAVVETRSSKAISVVSHGITFTGTLYNDGRVYLTGNQTFSMTGDWTSGRIYGTVGGNDGTPYFNIPTLVINNMI